MMDSPSKTIQPREVSPEGCAKGGIHAPSRSLYIPRTGALSTKRRLLIVDDTVPILDMFREYFADMDFAVVYSSSGEDAMRLVQDEPFNVVVTDLRMEPVSGLDVIKFVKEYSPDTEVIVLTGYASVDSTVEAIRYGVFDYVEKPVNLERFGRLIENAFDKNSLTLENQYLVSLLSEQNKRLENRVREVTRDLEELSTRDGLTGLFNYRYFTNTLGAEVSRSVRYNRPLSLAMIDIDFFKSYNDTHGHQEGNRALVKLAKVLRDATRENDLAVRYGGEEFAMVFPETTRPETVTIMERIRTDVTSLNMTYDHPDGEAKPLTVSVGVAACPEDGRTVHSLLDRADAALYRAKAEGRDRLCIA